MAMNTIIRERRRELGLTQEQVAEALGVSAPAVNKWEKGITMPDTGSLPALARLLGTDLNALFCFEEELSREEIYQFCNEVVELAEKEGIQAGISRISGKLREYPNCGSLLQMVSNVADGLLIMSDLRPEEKTEYEKQILSWYQRAAASADGDVREQACFMLASKYRSQGEYEKTQDIIDQLPERKATDKNMLQVSLYEDQGKTAEAIELLEKGLLGRVSEVWGILIRLVDLEIADGNPEEAGRIAGISREMSELFDLWEYNRYVGDLSVALARQQTAECIQTLEKLLTEAMRPWEMWKSPLYCRIAKKQTPGEHFGKRMLRPLLTELENSEKYAFLRQEEAFQKLLEKYHRRCTEETPESPRSSSAHSFL